MKRPRFDVGIYNESGRLVSFVKSVTSRNVAGYCRDEAEKVQQGVQHPASTVWRIVVMASGSGPLPDRLVTVRP